MSQISIKLPASWKTFAVGLASAVWAVVIAFHNPDLTALVHDPQFKMAVLVAIGNFLSKDFNVTGGTVGTPSTPTALQAANQAASAVNPPTGPAAPAPPPPASAP